ncbi:hypothetical protein VPH35_114192 [Triticum aestivum]|uniref:BTB/POZ and MATH domain-containing protein 2-like n=1 Tax=Triticum aestivum TaxID=4565 RepID=UPI001D0150CB|nr:BTB/POZ and MATH domain-containing protein 2-like [Triticum aestivum]
MSSFAGVSVLDGGKLCPSTKTFVKTSSACGYHLLVVQGYAQTKKETPAGRCIASRDFGVGGHRWSIAYYPNGENVNCAEFVSLYVCRLNCDEKHVEAKFEFSFIDEVEWQNQVCIRGTKTYSFPSDAPSWGHSRFMKIDALERSMNLEEDDCFTVRCDIMVCDNTEDDASGTELVLVPDIHHNLNNLLGSKVGADVTFEVNGATFAVHRCVLAAQSKVFMAQLFGPMKEGTSTSGVIHIQDMEATVFKALLNFIYTDSFPNMDDDIMEDGEMSEAMEEGQEEEPAVEGEKWLQWLQDLLVAADRYDVQRLKFICEKQLSEHISVGSVMSTLSLAEQHHCQGLKQACFKFIQVQSPSCLQTVMASNGWDHVCTTYPSVLKELFAMLASKHHK